jgi:hypothetical protein
VVDSQKGQACKRKCLGSSANKQAKELSYCPPRTAGPAFLVGKEQVLTALLVLAIQWGVQFPGPAPNPADEALRSDAWEVLKVEYGRAVAEAGAAVAGDAGGPGVGVMNGVLVNALRLKYGPVTQKEHTGGSQDGFRDDGFHDLAMLQTSEWRTPTSV